MRRLNNKLNYKQMPKPLNISNQQTDEIGRIDLLVIRFLAGDSEMNKQVWKFDLQLVDMQPIKMPEDAEILSVQEQGGILRIWALVNPDNKKEVRDFEVFGTGHNIYYDMGVERKYIATVIEKDRPLVWHIFERIN